MDKIFLIQPVKNNLRTYDNIRKIEIDKSDGCTTGSSLDYSYFEEFYCIS